MTASTFRRHDGRERTHFIFVESILRSRTRRLRWFLKQNQGLPLDRLPPPGRDRRRRHDVWCCCVHGNTIAAVGYTDGNFDGLDDVVALKLSDTGEEIWRFQASCTCLRLPRRTMMVTGTLEGGWRPLEGPTPTAAMVQAIDSRCIRRCEAVA